MTRATRTWLWNKKFPSTQTNHRSFRSHLCGHAVATSSGSFLCSRNRRATPVVMSCVGRMKSIAVQTGISGGWCRRSASATRHHNVTAGRTAIAKATSLDPVTAPYHSWTEVLREFSRFEDPRERSRALLSAATLLPKMAEEDKIFANRVMGCTAQVWVTARLDSYGRVQFQADSDSALTRGLAALLVSSLSGLLPEEVLEFSPEQLRELDLGAGMLTPSRSNGFLNMLQTMKKRALALQRRLPVFPSLVITADDLQPQGAFAEAQARYLQPDARQIAQLAELLQRKRIGVVAHFYMDPQVQGVLTSAAEVWPHIHISDSLVMADRAVKMAEAGCKYVCVLGVDFMSENVRAILDEAGYHDVKVYRMSSDSIGCSLAEAAESQKYIDYLTEAGRQPNSMHVIYINTSLRTKASANCRVPTITCTSSNVVQTVLQGFAQIPDLHVWYGPDTYMGNNLQQLIHSLAQLSDEEIKELHPDHTQESIRSLLPRLHYFQDGTCIVHHIFGGEACMQVREAYADAYVTAHFEVPGEMFTLAMEAKRRGMGVVGSTSNLLAFITSKVQEYLSRPYKEKLQFVLGTESGMITSIVRQVQRMLQEADARHLEVEIVFPVSSDSITTADTAHAPLPGGLAVVPGPAGGEGCSSEGGCASCPYMKMNSLRALRSVCDLCGEPDEEARLAEFQPRFYTEPAENGQSMAQAGCVSILHMRDFQAAGKLPDGLVDDIASRHP